MDAITQVKTQLTGLGAVVRDFVGNFILATQMQAKFDGDLLAAEVKAIKQGIEIAKIVGCVLLIIEFNFQEAVDLVIRRKCSKPKIF